MIEGNDYQRRVRCGKTKFRQLDNPLMLRKKVPDSASWFSHI